MPVDIVTKLSWQDKIPVEFRKRTFILLAAWNISLGRSQTLRRKPGLRPELRPACAMLSAPGTDCGPCWTPGVEGLVFCDPSPGEIVSPPPCLISHVPLLRTGVTMKLMDEVAGIVAARHCKTNIVTASVDAINFHDKIRKGNGALLTGRRGGLRLPGCPAPGCSWVTSVSPSHSVCPFATRNRNQSPVLCPC